MKNIFKKNHIIITALLIMIVIAGYLSFTNSDTVGDTDDVTTVLNPDTDEYDRFTELDGMEVVTDTDDTDVTDDEDITDDTDVTDDDDEVLDDTDVDDEDAELEDEADELGDISDEDILSSAQNVSDNGELDLEEGVPGEAVLASAVVDGSFYISSKLDREQTRSKQKANLFDIIESDKVSEELRNEATNKMFELTDNFAKEDSAEKLLEAKGFSNSLVYIVNDKATVLVDAETLTDQQLAIVESVVADQTGIAVEKITINPAVIAE